jgi:hypothetical protein
MTSGADTLTCKFDVGPPIYGTTYTFFVRAINGVGHGADSAPSNSVLNGTPSDPQCIIAHIESNGGTRVYPPGPPLTQLFGNLAGRDWHADYQPDEGWYVSGSSAEPSSGREPCGGEWQHPAGQSFSRFVLTDCGVPEPRPDNTVTHCRLKPAYSPLIAVTVTVGLNGSVSTFAGDGSPQPVSSPMHVVPGDEVVLQISPDSGYQVEVDGTCGGSLVETQFGATFSTSPITAPCALAINFQRSWSCPGGEILSQAALDELAHCTAIGHLHIGKLGVTTDINNLESLSGVTTISALWIQSTELKNIDGLRNLESISQHLFITDNSELLNLDGLSSLINAGRAFVVGGNHKLTDVSGLSNVTTAGSFLIWENDALPKVELNALTELQDFGIGGESLTSISGLANLGRVRDNLTIRDAPLLSDLSAFASVKTIGLGLRIEHTAIQNLNDFSGLESLLGGLNLSSNGSLSSITGLRKAFSGGALNGHLTLSGNSLTNLNGLESLSAVNGNLDLSERGLKDIGGLSGLQVVAGRLVLSKGSLTNVDGLSALASIGQGSSDATWGIPGLSIIDLDILENLDGLRGLSGSLANLEITDNDSLTSLDGLSGVTSVTGDLAVEANSSLASLSGFENIASVGGSLRVLYNNKSLDDQLLRGLGECTAIAELLGYPNGPPDDSVGGGIYLGTEGGRILNIESDDEGNVPENAEGCNSIDDVLRSKSIAEGTTTAPGVPVVTNVDPGDQDLSLHVTANNGGNEITSYDATCTDGTNTYLGTSATSPITVSGLTNDVAYTCTVTATNSVGTSSASAATPPITPEEQVGGGLPIWLLYQATQ